MSNNLKNLRMCIQKQTTRNLKQLQHIERSLKYSSTELGKSKAAFYSSKVWVPGSIIRIKFLHNPPPNLPRTKLASITGLTDAAGKAIEVDPLQETVDKMEIIDAIQLIVYERLQSYTGINLLFVDDVQDADVRISFDPNSGAWSLIGTDCKQEQNQNVATMNFGWFDVATVIHEFGHALGMIHEHQNPDGNPIQWNRKLVYEWAKQTQGWDEETAYAQIIQPYLTDAINGSKFDPQSIMLYFFPGKLTTNNQGTHENLRLSPQDVIYLNRQYPTTGGPCGHLTCISPETFYKDTYKVDIGKGQNLPGDPTISSDTSKYVTFSRLDIILIIFVIAFIIVNVYIGIIGKIRGVKKIQR